MVVRNKSKIFLNPIVKKWPCRHGQILSNFSILQVKNLNFNGEKIHFQREKRACLSGTSTGHYYTTFMVKRYTHRDLRSTSWTSFFYVCLFKAANTFISGWWGCPLVQLPIFMDPHEPLNHHPIQTVFLLCPRFEFQVETFTNVFETSWFLPWPITRNAFFHCCPAFTYHTGKQVSQALWHVISFFLEANAGHK